jgi:2-keto-4-pentenoate hydratase
MIKRRIQRLTQCFAAGALGGLTLATWGLSVRSQAPWVGTLRVQAEIPAQPAPTSPGAAPPRGGGYLGLMAASLAEHYLLGYPAMVVTQNLGFRQVNQVQLLFVRRLSEDLGPVVGYKAALTNPTAQARFQLTHPLYGFLLEDMVLDSGATLPADFAVTPMAEGDLMVRVKDASINQATTDAELLAALDAVIPFIELPDLIYANPAQVNASALVAANVGARYGVMGEAIALEPTDDWQTRLGNIRVVIKNGQGQYLTEGTSRALGHPLTIVRWLRDTLNSQGIELRPGDLLSLGTLTPILNVEADMVLEAEYFGLHADLEQSERVRVSIEAAE